jgi:hypothetical protein
MKAFFVGLLVLLAVMLFSFIGIFLFPLIIVMGFFLKWLIGIVLIIFAIWFLGYITLWAIEQLKKKDHS